MHAVNAWQPMFVGRFASARTGTHTLLPQSSGLLQPRFMPLSKGDELRSAPPARFVWSFGVACPVTMPECEVVFMIEIVGSQASWIVWRVQKAGEPKAEARRGIVRAYIMVSVPGWRIEAPASLPPLTELCTSRRRCHRRELAGFLASIQCHSVRAICWDACPCTFLTHV